MFYVLKIFQIYRPPQTDVDIVNARFRNGDPVYKHPMIPGYEGEFVNCFFLLQSVFQAFSHVFFEVLPS